MIVDQNVIPLKAAIEDAHRHDLQILLETLNSMSYAIQIANNQALYLDRRFHSIKFREIASGHNVKA